MRKKLLLLGLTCSLLLTQLACGGVSEADSKAEESQTQEVVEQETQEQDEVITIKDVSSWDIINDMKVGWCLGNTLESTGVGVMSEIAWGNPKTKKEMIDAVIDEGFNVIRIPVTWEGHFGGAPDYLIMEPWLARVKEVVDYAYERDVYVILNMHHEEWHYPSEENKEQATQQLVALWTQIANYFKDYDEHLIFEGLNEPRKKGTAVEWTGGDEEGRSVVNHYMKAFVETVRATGGNNKYRHLMVCSYAASSDRKALEAVELPEDPKLIVSVHAYTPYNFALNINGTNSWSIDNTADTQDIDTVMKNIDEVFIKNQIPVILGEFGAMNKENEEARAQWVGYYLDKAKEINVPCIWFDNNLFTGDGEKFGLYNRRELKFQYPLILDAIQEHGMN